MNQGRCEKCSVEHCAKCPINSSTCIECQTGYKLTLKGCEKKAYNSINLMFEWIDSMVIFKNSYEWRIVHWIREI